MGFPFCSTLRVPGGQLSLHTDTGTWYTDITNSHIFRIALQLLRILCRLTCFDFFLENIQMQRYVFRLLLIFGTITFVYTSCDEIPKLRCGCWWIKPTVFISVQILFLTLSWLQPRINNKIKPTIK